MKGIKVIVEARQKVQEKEIEKDVIFNKLRSVDSTVD